MRPRKPERILPGLHHQTPIVPLTIDAASAQKPMARIKTESLERAMVELAMRQANNNQTHAAKLLDISRDALRYKLKKFGLIRGDEEASQTTAAEDQS